jgi:hypothetical protein
MPLDILHLLASRTLPVEVHGIRKVEAIRVLVLSGHVEAIVPSIEPSLTPSSPVAITPSGRRMLQTFPATKTPARSKLHRRNTRNL